jgi:hypothetical protein
VGSCNSIQQQKLSNGGISQPHIFSYSYEHDGRLMTQEVNWVGLQDTFAWKYAPSGRELTESDPLTGQSALIMGGGNNYTKFVSKAYQYDAYGRVSQLTLPEQYVDDV